MTRIELAASVRQESGKGSSRRLRTKELIPAVLYGRGEKPLNIAVAPAELKRAIATPKKMNTILTLKLDNNSERTVLLKDYQTDIVSHSLVHADFIAVSLDRKVLVKVPVSYVGTAVGVTEGGILQTMRRELEVLALPVDIPERVEVDVSHLKIGGSLHVKDVKFPQGVTPKYTTNFAIAAVVAPEKEEVPAAAAAEAAAGAAAAAPAAGAPAAAGAAAPAAGAAAAAPAKGGAAPAKK